MIKLPLLSHTERPKNLFIMGETLVDLVIDHQQKEHTFLGGSPTNIAVNCTQLGLKPTLFSAVSNDPLGQEIYAKLEAFQVDTHLIQRVSQTQSRVQMNQSDATPHPIFFRESDFNVLLNQTVLEAFDQSKIFHFSYWPLTREPAVTIVKTLLKRAKEHHTLVSFDPNIHTALQHDETITRDDLYDVLHQVDILKPSLDDAARLFGAGKSAEDYMSRFESFDIPLIMMTLGKEGVLVSHHKVHRWYPAVSTRVVDTTGAGDAFWSGFYCGLLHHKSLDETIALAQHLSGKVLQTLGAIVPLPPCEELLEGND